MEGARAINWLEAVAWGGLTVLLLTSIGAMLRHVWNTLLGRVKALEGWQEDHEREHRGFEVEIKLQLRDLQNESKNHTALLEKMGEKFEKIEERMGELAALVGNRRNTERRTRKAEAAGQA